MKQVTANPDDFYAPTSRVGGIRFALFHLSKNSVTEVEKLGHLCVMDTFLVIYINIISFIKQDNILHYNRAHYFAQ